MKIKRRFTLSNLLMLITPILGIGVISAVFAIVFLGKYSLEAMGIGREYADSSMSILKGLIEFIQKNPDAMKLILLYIILCILAVAIPVTVLTKGLSKSICTPISQLTDAAKKIKNDNLDFSVMGSEYEEINRLCQMFDDMRIRLKESKDKEAALRNERSMLLANLSHDLKTPVTSIKGYVDGIRDGIADTPEKQQKYLDTIYQKATLIDDMVNNLSMFSKLEMSRLEFFFEIGDFWEFAAETAEEYRLDFSKNQIRLEVGEPVKATVKIDYEKMHRVLANLFENCIKYKSEGQGLVQVSGRVKYDGVFLTVEDTGIGIDESKLEAVFQSFYRVDTARTMNIKGSGLGLGIAKQIVEHHGGKIWLKSGEDKGTAAIIYLPLYHEKKEEETDGKNSNY